MRYARAPLRSLSRLRPRASGRDGTARIRRTGGLLGLTYAVSFDEVMRHVSFRAAQRGLRLGFCAGIDVTGRPDRPPDRQTTCSPECGGGWASGTIIHRLRLFGTDTEGPLRVFGAAPPPASAGAGAEGSTRHAIEPDEAGEAVNAPERGSTGHVNAPLRAEAWAERRARMRAFLNKGRGYRAWLDADDGRSTKHLAEREGCSRPRICQLLVLTRLAPEIQADLDDETRTTPVPTERELRAIADLPAVEQVWKYMELTGELVEVRDSRKVARLAGFQHLFARARALRERYDSGQYRNLDELGATEGITGGRASQLMNLLLLAPEIIAALDVPKGQAPRLSERELRKIARLFEHEEQRVVFERMVRAVGG